MRNFNADRDINLSEYLPVSLKNVREISEIMRVETSEVRALWQSCEKCLDDQFLSESTEYGIARREKMLGITPYVTDTLEDRRFRLLSRYNESRPYTRRSLENLISSLCGTNGYALLFKTNEFTVCVKVALTSKKQEESIRELLERILPYNMVFTVELLYNTWEKVRPYTWSALSGMSWEGMKEEVLS